VRIGTSGFLSPFVGEDFRRHQDYGGQGGEGETLKISGFCEVFI